MPLRKPQKYFEEKQQYEEQQAVLAEEAAVKEKRFQPPSAISRGLPEPSFTIQKKEVPVVEERKLSVVESLTERIDSLAVGMPDNDKLWSKLSGIENSIVSLQFDKLDRESVVRLFEIVTHLEETLGSLEYDKSSHTRLVETVEHNDSHIREVNDRLIESTISITSLREMVEAVVLPSTEDNKESIESIRVIHDELAAAVDQLPKKSFDPSGIIESIKDLRETITQDIISTRQELNQKVEVIPEVRHYEDDLDSLQNFISEVRDSIKYYDSDVDELKESLLDLGHHLGKTITEKVSKLNKDHKNLSTRVIKADKKLAESIENLPEVKYYDDEIDVIENKIHTILTSIKELPEVKYYDEDVTALSSALDTLNAKIDAIDIPDWSNVIEGIQADVVQLAALQQDFDDRWEKSAESKPDILNPETNFVTFADMQKHYRVFLERVQIQLGSLGGGGAINILDMEDLDENVGRFPENYNNQYMQLKHNSVTGVTSFTMTEEFIENISNNDIGELNNVDTTGARQGMVLVYIEATGNWEAKAVQYIGVNIDANPDPEIQDYGSYS